MKITELSPAELQQALAAGKITLIDVREPTEFKARRIQGAQSMPLSTFDPRKLPSPAERSVVFNCGVGRRSAMAIEKCAAAGVAHSTHLRGGLDAWIAAGLPTVSS